jgi:hypothetical protein
MDGNVKQKVKFLIYTGDSDWYNYIYNEAINDKNAMLMGGSQPKMKSFMKPLCKFHFSKKINKIINLPLKSLWFNHLSQIKNIEKESLLYILFFDSNKYTQESRFHTYLRKIYPNCKLVYVFSGVFNVSHAKNSNYILNLKTDFDMVITFDKIDATKYNWEYCPFPYSKSTVMDSDLPESDIFFVGYAEILP